MAWDVLDFAVFIALVVGVGVILALTARKTSNTSYRCAVGLALAAAFLLVWVNGAVGIIGDEGNDANLMYFGVLAIAILGAVIARFHAPGMARAMYATALAQVLVAAIALTAGLGSTGPIWPRDILFLTGSFAVLWLASAWLFRKAARQQLSGDADPKGLDSRPDQSPR